jgi:hypothetical protein
MKNIVWLIFISLWIVTIFNTGCTSKDKLRKTMLEERVFNKDKLFHEYDKILKITDSASIDINLFRNTYYYVIDNYRYPFDYKEFHNLLSNYSIKIALDSSKRDMHNYIVIQELIKKEIDLNPFEELNDNQKNLLMRFKKTLDGNELISSKIILKEDIKNLLLNQNREVESLKSRNIILTIIGILLSLTFGFLQLFYPKGLRDILKRYATNVNSNGNSNQSNNQNDYPASLS